MIPRKPHATEGPGRKVPGGTRLPPDSRVGAPSWQPKASLGQNAEDLRGGATPGKEGGPERARGEAWLQDAREKVGELAVVRQESLKEARGGDRESPVRRKGLLCTQPWRVHVTPTSSRPWGQLAPRGPHLPLVCRCWPCPPRPQIPGRQSPEQSPGSSPVREGERNILFGDRGFRDLQCCSWFPPQSQEMQEGLFFPFWALCLPFTPPSPPPQATMSQP